MVDVVIGAGIVGASCAYHLQRSGRDTVLVDTALPGRATDAGAGIVSALGAAADSAAWDAFGAASCGYYEELAAELAELGETEHGWRRVGQLMVAVDGDERIDQVLAHAQEVTGRFGAAALGVPELLDRDAVNSLWPGLAASAAVWLDRVARVDGRLFRDALVGACRRLGGQVRPGRATLTRRAQTFTAAVDGAPLDADAVVVAAGAWSAQLLAAAGVPGVQVRPQRGQILHAHLPGCGERPIVSTLDRHYLLTFPGDRVVFGATREDGAGFDAAVTVAGLAEITAAVLRVAPEVAAARVLETRVGLRPSSLDGLPVLGQVPGTANLYVATGLGHSGLTLGPHSGRVVANAIAAGGDVPAWPAQFDVARFGGGGPSPPTELDVAPFGGGRRPSR